MSVYSCSPCMKTFNGIKPYESHLVSEKHRKKVNGTTSIVQDFQNSKIEVNKPTSIVQDFQNCSFNSSYGEQEPFIIFVGKEYRCTLCKSDLNSMDQVKTHIRGAKHLKAKASHGYTDSLDFSSHNRSLDQMVSSPSLSAHIEDPQLLLSNQVDEITQLVKNIKVFKPNDEIAF